MPDISSKGMLCGSYKSQLCFVFHTLNAQAIKSGYVLASSFPFHRSELTLTYFLCIYAHFKVLFPSCALPDAVWVPSVESPCFYLPPLLFL